MNHWDRLAAALEADPQYYRAPGDVWGTNPVSARIAFYRTLAKAQPETRDSGV